MYTVIHPAIADSRFRADGNDIIREFTSMPALLDYFLDDLRPPLRAARQARFAAIESSLADTVNPPKPSRSPTEWFKTTLWQHADYSGKSVTLSNLVDSIDVEWKLSDNGLNDKVSSVHVGLAIACAVLFQHTYLRGKQLWLIGGQEPSKRDLSAVKFDGGGSWNDRVSSALSATLSPAQVAKWIAGAVF